MTSDLFAPVQFLHIIRTPISDSSVKPIDLSVAWTIRVLTPSKRASGFSTGSAAIATTVVRRGLNIEHGPLTHAHGVFPVIRYKMKKSMKTKTIGLGVLLSVAAAAMCFASNPTLGTWKLNESKSTFGDGAGKTTLVVWEKVGDQQKCTVDGTDADGKKTHSEWTGKMDGKFYAVTGDPQADQRSFKKSDDNTIAMVTQKDGKTVGDGTIVVAADRKSRTVTSAMTNAKGPIPLIPLISFDPF